MDRDKSIIAQNAGTTAANLVNAAVAAGTLAPASTEELFDTFDNVRTAVFNGTLSLAGAESVVQQVEGDTAAAAKSEPAPFDGVNGDLPNADVEIKVGKHRGKTIGDVYFNEDEGEDYLTWAAGNMNNEWLRSRIADFLKAAA